MLGFIYGVVKKFGDDQAGYLAALIAYYAFFSLFPLLLVFVTILGFVLERQAQRFFVPPQFLERLERSRPASKVYLDKHQRGGRLVRRWNLIVPDRWTMSGDAESAATRTRTRAERRLRSALLTTARCAPSLRGTPARR